MPHIKTQIRKAVMDRIAATARDFALVCPGGRLLRQIQSNEFPIAAVGVAEGGVVPVGKNLPGHRAITRTMIVTVQIALSADADDIDEKADDLQVKLEAALADPKALGVGSLMDWSFDGSTGIAGEMLEYGLAVVSLTYSCRVTTPDGQGDINIHS